MQSEFLHVPKDLKRFVIGRGGKTLQGIIQRSGASVSAGSRDVEGFTIAGDEKQRACAKRLILEVVQVQQQRMLEEALPGELVEVPAGYKGIVFGKWGETLKKISAQTGATVIRKQGEVYIVSGTDEQRQQAKVQIKIIIAGSRVRGVENEFNKFCCYIDDWKLPKDCKLKLEQAVQADRVVIPGSQAQYRLKPAEDYGPQESCSPSHNPSYMSRLVKDTLESLRKIKHEMKTKEYLKADMWCHFGTTIIRGLDEEEDAEQVWTVDGATKKLEPSKEKDHWKTAFKEGVNLEEKILEENAWEKTHEEYEDYSSRYDLAFLTPCGYQVRFKVWVIKKNINKKLEDIPVPFTDVKNILDEIHFENELTRKRCRGWLVLPSRRYLQADILFPGCEFDCRFTIRGRTENALVTDCVPKEDEREALSRYVSKLTLTDEDGLGGLCLPDLNIPEGFHLIQKRLSKRSLYEFIPGFTIILSKERSWRSDMSTVESRESNDFHLHCREWDELLNSGDWEPDKIAEKIPEFLRFVKKVQGVVVHEMKDPGLTKTIPPEILARGRSAREAYNKALADGETSLRRVPIMLIGQDRAGKTSLKKSLKGICFDPDEDSTVGIDVDPSHFKVTTETWKTGTSDNDQNSDEAISFDYQTARCIFDSLKNDQRRPGRSIDSGGSAGGSDSGGSGEPFPGQRSTGPARDPEQIQTSVEPAPSSSRDVIHVSPDTTEVEKVDVNRLTALVPEDVAALTETLLQGNRRDSGEDTFSSLWDFAGQSVYYVTHPLFLTPKAIYCLVYDLSLNPQDRAKPLVKQGVFKKNQESFNLKTNVDYLDFWMTSVASLTSTENERRTVGPKLEVLPAKLPPVFLVCTHADKPYGGGDPRELSREIFGYLKDKPYGAHLSDVFFVDNTRLSVHKTECLEVVRLRKEVLDAAKDLPHINEVIPVKWLKFEKVLHALKGKEYKYISLETAKNVASTVCNINDSKEFETLMNYLHDLRRLIHFGDSPELNKLVVLDPQWLIDVFKKVITVKPYDSGEKRFVKLWHKLERNGILDEELLAHVWGPLFDNRETSESLIGIMEKFSLLCPWPSDTAETKIFLIPSMLKTHPPEEVIGLLQSARIPSLFLKFENGLVPPGLFPRLVLQFFQWGKGTLWSPVNPELFHGFARFFISEDEDCSVILACHSSSIEVVIHRGNDSFDLAEDLSSKMYLATDNNYDSAESNCAGLVRKQLELMLERMRNEFCYLRNMKYEMSVMCPVCCNRGTVNLCRTHHVQSCKEEQCLHFWSVSELCSGKTKFNCTKLASAKITRVQVGQFAPWFPTLGQQLAIGEQDGRQPSPGNGNEEKALALPSEVLESVLSQSSDCKQIVSRLSQKLQLDQASLEEPGPETKKVIRCLARQAKCSHRDDVVKHLREIVPAGTTGPLLPEGLDVRRIPVEQARQLTITLMGGDEWKPIAEKLGLNPQEIRFLDRRYPNPAAELLIYIADRRGLTVGNLYDVLVDSGLPRLADDYL